MEIRVFFYLLLNIETIEEIWTNKSEIITNLVKIVYFYIKTIAFFFGDAAQTQIKIYHKIIKNNINSNRENIHSILCIVMDLKFILSYVIVIKRKKNTLKRNIYEKKTV